MSFLEDVLGIGRKIKRTVSYAGDKLSDAAGATFDFLKQSPVSFGINKAKQSIEDFATRNPTKAGSILDAYGPTEEIPFMGKSFTMPKKTLVTPYIKYVGAPQSEALIKAAKSAVKFIPPAMPFTKPGAEDIGNVAAGIGAINPVQPIIGGAFGAVMKAGENLTTGKPATKDLYGGYRSGFEFQAKLGPLSNLTGTVLKPLLSKLNPTGVTEINSYINVAKNAISKEARDKAIALAKNAFFRQVGEKAVRGAVGMGALGATEPAKDWKERASNTFTNAIMGAVFEAGQQVISTGAKVGMKQLIEPAKAAYMKMTPAERQGGFSRTEEFANLFKKSTRDAKTPEEGIQGLVTSADKMLAGLAPTGKKLTPKKINDLKAMRAALNKQAYEIAGVNPAAGKGEKAVYETAKQDPEVGAFIAKAEEYVAKIDDIIAGKPVAPEIPYVTPPSTGGEIPKGGVPATADLIAKAKGKISDPTIEWLDTWVNADVPGRKISVPTPEAIAELGSFKSKEPVKLYRGVRPDQTLNQTGFESWTHDKKIAKGFSKGGSVQERMVSPDEIIIDFTKVPKSIRNEHGLFNQAEREVIVKSSLNNPAQLPNPPLSPTEAGGVVAQPRKTAQQIIQEVTARPRDVNASLKTGAINPDEAAALKGTMPELIAKSKQRGFVSSVQEAKNVTKKTKAGVTGEYTIQPDEQLMGEAKALLEEGASIDIRHTKDIDKKVAATIQAAINQQKTNPNAAANLFNNLSDVGTELGRGVHAFDMLDKMTPEAISLSVAGKIKKYNMTARKPIPELTGGQVKLITDRMTAVDALKGREKNIALNELQNTLNEFIPSTIADKAITVWKAGLLTSLRTHERNIIGNTIMTGAEIIKDPFASVADMIMSAKTGKRSMTTTLQGIRPGSKKGAQAMVDVVRYGYDPEDAIAKFDHKAITWDKTPVQQFLKKATDAVFRTLAGEDKVFWHSAYARSLYDQAGTEAINVGKQGNKEFIEALVGKPTAEMLKIALNDANYATFHDKNILSGVAVAIKKAAQRNYGDTMNNKDIGTTASELGKVVTEVLAPFTGVPSSIAGKTIAYSPIGLIKGAIDMGRVLATDVPNLQRQAAQEVGRGTVGTGIFGLGAYLMSKGLMTGQPKDPKEADLWATEGKMANSILIGGKWRSINSVGPQTLVMLAGAKYAEEMGDPEGSMGAYAGGLAKDQLSQTFLAGVQGPLNAITDPARYGKNYVGNTVASMVPNIIKDWARSGDASVRENNTAFDYVKSGIPGLRNTLTEKRDVIGNVIPQEPTGIAAFFDLFNSKTPIDNTVVNELGRLAEAGSEATPSRLDRDQTIRKEKVKLTFEQLNGLEAGVGEALKPQLETLITSETYTKLSDEEKASAISNVVKDVRLKYKNINAEAILGAPGGEIAVKGATVTPGGTGEPTVAKDLTYSYVDDSGNYKTIDVAKVADMPETTRYEKTLKEKAGFKLVDDILTNLPEEQQKSALEAVGMDEKVATYYEMARQGDDEKYSYVLDAFDQLTNRNDMLKALVQGRYSVNGKMVASNGVIEKLYDDGFITLAESKALKKMEIDENGKPIKKASATGTGSTAAKKAAVKSIASGLAKGPDVGSMQALIAETKARRQEYATIPRPSPDAMLATENAKNTVPVKLDTLITKAKTPKGIAKARAIIASLSGGGSVGNTPTKLSMSGYRPSLRA